MCVVLGRVRPLQSIFPMVRWRYVALYWLAQRVFLFIPEGSWEAGKTCTVYCWRSGKVAQPVSSKAGIGVAAPPTPNCRRSQILHLLQYRVCHNVFCWVRRFCWYCLCLKSVHQKIQSSRRMGGCWHFCVWWVWGHQMKYRTPLTFEFQINIE